jgi:pyrroloquinoline quinone biosynthesis protein E
MVNTGTMGNINPSILHFHITSRCPYGCRYCCSDSGVGSSDGELDVEAIRKMLDKAVFAGMEEIDLSGGDPLVLERTSVLEIVRHASRQGLLTILNTNAWFLDEEYVTDLKDAGLDRVKSSLHGTSRRTHEDFTRKEGSFEKVKNVLEHLKKNEIEVWINYVVTPKNIDEVSVF